MLGWMLAEVPEIQNFLRDRGFIDDHNAHEFGRYFNVLQVEPVTVPQGELWSTVTMITFKSWSERQGFMNRHGGQAGIRLYVDEQTPQHGVHIRVSPCSPQWHRKLEAPIRVLLSCINSHPDFQATPPSIFVLWKTLTLMAPTAQRGFQDDASAWARLFYSEVGGEFKGRLELRPDLTKSAILRQLRSGTMKACGGRSGTKSSGDTTHPRPRRSRDIQGSEELIGYIGQRRAQGKKHRPLEFAAIHNGFGEPFPFELEVVQVDMVAFSWDEYCMKAGAADKKVNDAKACAYQGCPVAAAPAADHNATLDGFDPSAALDEIQNREPKQSLVGPRQKGKPAIAKKQGKGS